MESAITVAAGNLIDPTCSIPDEPYFHFDPENNNDGDDKKKECQRHAISRDAFTEPPISSVTIRVSPLVEWEGNWLDIHQDHVSCGEDDNDENTVLGDLPEDDHAEWEEIEIDGQGSGHLLVCCGSARPQKSAVKYQITVKSKTKEEGGLGFITVHDFLGQVHPWLMEIKADILEAKAVATALLQSRDEVPSREEILATDGGMKLFVGGASPRDLSILDEAQWADERRAVIHS